MYISPVNSYSTAYSNKFVSFKKDDAVKTPRMGGLTFGEPSPRGIMRIDDIEDPGKNIKKIHINNTQHLGYVWYHDENGKTVMVDNHKTGLPKGRFDKGTIINEIKQNNISLEKYEIYYNDKLITKEDLNSEGRIYFAPGDGICKSSY